jgi:hypothetical protein
MRPLQPDAGLPAARSSHLVSSQHKHAGRGALSRRGFIGSAAGVGVLMGAGLLHPAHAIASKLVNATPNPIPGGLTVGGQQFHVLFFGPGKEPATITDFSGFVGVADVQGTGTATNPDGSTRTLLFDTDMRFMTGVYVGQDGAVHEGTFGFV